MVIEPIEEGNKVKAEIVQILKTILDITSLKIYGKLNLFFVLNFVIFIY